MTLKNIAESVGLKTSGIKSISVEKFTMKDKINVGVMLLIVLFIVVIFFRGCSQS